MQYEKVYVGMFLYMSPDGNAKPVELEWTDGVRYAVTKVISKRFTPPEHVGSSPAVRFDVEICGREKTVYYEKFSKRWFVEKRV